MDIKGYSLAILGDSGVGKTCFATRFCGENFNEENKERLKPTRGAEYFQRIFYYNKESIKIDIYDISGDKKYEKVSKYLYRYVRSIILMYNICNLETFEHLKYFFDNIGSISVENPSIYIVGNFGDKAKFQRQVNETHLKKYKNEVSKFYEISALYSQDRDFKIILDDITRGIVYSGKWYETKIYKDLGDLNSVENENKNEKLKKDLKNFNKEKKPYYLRCKSCEKLFIIKFKTIFNEINFICDNCKINETIKIADINKYTEDNSNRINCQMCFKKIDSKYKLVYCNTCKKYFCPSCEKTHDKKFRAKKEDIDSNHNKCPYYLMDIGCLEDGQKNIGHCKKCEISFCAKCFSNHKQHDITYFDDFVEQLINENKEKIYKEIEIIKNVKNNCQDCINTIRGIFEDFISIKEKEIKLKTDLVNQLSFIQYNYQLIETVRSFRYLTEIKYDRNSSWDQKLTDLFEVLHSPIQIKNINIQKKEFNIPSRIELGYNDKRKASDMKEITDFCSMNNDKYIGITFSDGSLELYDDFIQNKEPLKIFKIFDNIEIESIRKSNRNVNNFFLCAKNIIKNIEFYDDYKNYKIIKEIIDEEDKVFIFTLELNDYIVAIDSFNKIYLFDKENKKVGEITDCIDPLGQKQIFSLNEISKNKFYITFNKKEENTGRASIGRPNLKYGFDELNDDAGDNNDNNFTENIIDIGTKIINIDNCRVVNQYPLPDKEEVLGAIHDSVILIRDDVYNSIILFDADTYKIIKRFYWELGGKPVFLDVINKRAKLVDFILVDENFNIFQNIFEEEAKNITQISGVKNIKNDFKININNFNRGKIINNPFRSILNYIGENKFIVVNY